MQSPREESSLKGADFFFVRPLPPVNDPHALRIEDEAWASCRSAATRQPCEAYLSNYPQGRYAELARERLVGLPVEPTSPLPPSGGTFTDCDGCPEMVVISGGSFLMGNPGKEPARYDEDGPQRRVNVTGFALAKTEVTQAQWRALMGNNPSHHPQCGDDCPVENVSWHEAQLYVKRLSTKTGKQYALPSEAQWEYAARAGTTTTFHTGEAINTGQANFRAKAPVKVGSFDANAFGLHDMAGSVWEWVQDCYEPQAYPGKAPSDGSAYDVKPCTYRMVRGGSWYDFEVGLRTFGRLHVHADGRNRDLGFRVCRVYAVE